MSLVLYEMHKSNEQLTYKPPTLKGSSFERLIIKQLHVTSELIKFCSGKGTYSRDALINTAHADQVIRNAVHQIKREIKTLEKEKLIQRLNQYCKPTDINALKRTKIKSFEDVKRPIDLINYLLTKNNESYPLKQDVDSIVETLNKLDNQGIVGNEDQSSVSDEDQGMGEQKTVLTTPPPSPNKQTGRFMGSRTKPIDLSIIKMQKDPEAVEDTKPIDLSIIKMQKDPEAVEVMKNNKSYIRDCKKIRNSYLNPTDERLDNIVKSIVDASTERNPYFLMSSTLETAVKQCWMEVQQDHTDKVLKIWSKRSYEYLATTPTRVQMTFYNLVAAKLNYPNENRQYSSTKGGLRLQQEYENALSIFFEALKSHTIPVVY